MELILVRHGQTDSNVGLRYCGQTDIGLNEAGGRQAADVAERLFGRLGGRFDSIHSSPLSRAYDTAKAIAVRFGVAESDIVKADALLEGHFGVFEDLTYKEIMNNFPNEYKMWREDWEGYVIEGGESSKMVSDRVGAFFWEFLERNSGGTHLFVFHMGSMSFAMSSLLGLDIKSAWRFKIDNTGIVTIRVNREKYCYLTALNV